jgi:hypothetical protein
MTKMIRPCDMIILHTTPACNLPSIMRHGLLARVDALVTWKDNKEADLIRPGVNLWCPLNARDAELNIAHWNDDPHVVLVIDPTELQLALLKHQRGAWWRYFADIPQMGLAVRVNPPNPSRRLYR